MTCLLCSSQKIKKNFVSVNAEVNYSICGECNCHYQNPIIKSNYNDGYWEKAIDPDGRERIFVNERDDKIKNWYGDSANYVNRFKNIKVLDVGCGLGYFLTSLNDNIEKYGIEGSEFACDHIRKNFKDIKIINGTIDDLDNFDDKFEIIMLYHVIEHLENPKKAINLLKKKLKVGGTLIIGTPIVETYIQKIFGRFYRQYKKGHIFLFNLDSLKKTLKDQSFTIHKIEKPFLKQNIIH